MQKHSACGTDGLPWEVWALKLLLLGLLMGEGKPSLLREVPVNHWHVELKKMKLKTHPALHQNSSPVLRFTCHIFTSH